MLVECPVRSERMYSESARKSFKLGQSNSNTTENTKHSLIFLNEAETEKTTTTTVI